MKALRGWGGVARTSLDPVRYRYIGQPSAASFADEWREITPSLAITAPKGPPSATIRHACRVLGTFDLSGHELFASCKPWTIVRAGWRIRSSDTSPSSAMAFAPGVQLGRGVRPSSAVRSSIG